MRGPGSAETAMGDDPSPATDSVHATGNRRRALRLGLVAWVRDILLSVSIAAFVVMFLCQPVKVEGTSMLPQLADEQRIFISKIAYRLESVERGDVIVFKFPADPTRSYIKRVVGLPGEEVEIRRGKVYIDGHLHPEPYVPSSYRDHISHPAVSVAQGTYYVLGDHRTTSNDSRTWGTVDEFFISGKAVFAYWPPDRFGTVR